MCSCVVFVFFHVYVAMYIRSSARTRTAHPYLHTLYIHPNPKPYSRVLESVLMLEATSTSKSRIYTHGAPCDILRRHRSRVSHLTREGSKSSRCGPNVAEIRQRCLPVKASNTNVPRNVTHIRREDKTVFRLL